LSPTLSAIVADEVGPDVRGLREDAAADPHEHREQRAPEPEPDQHGGRVLLEDQQDDGRAEQSEPDREHPGDAAGAERDLQCASQAALAGGVGGADVRPDGEPHPGEPGERREPGAQDERDRAPEPQRELGVRRVLGDGQREEEDHRQRREEDAERGELASQIGARADLDRLGDLLHLRGALGGAEHLADQVVGERQRDQRDHQDQPEGVLLE
jgi:hypothetical protein